MTLVLQRTPSPACFYILLKIPDLLLEESRYYLVRFHRANNCASSSIDLRGVPLPDSSISALSLARAKEWLDLCRRTHQQCRPGQPITVGSQQSKLMRLINIQFQDRHSYTCRLVSHILGVDDVDYMTLSYRWTADVHKTRLVQKNHSLYYDAIPTNTWPQVYHDAVTVARHLGFQYLWIDALCIIQDDPEDWKEQASLMNIIYERGVLNIAGALGEKAEGLGVYRDPLLVFDCALSDASGHTWIFGDADDRHDDVIGPEAPLYKRGWTFQERVLSTRTINFGIQLFWECFEGKASERTRMSGPSFYDVPSILKRTLRNPASMANYPETYTTQGLLSHWQVAVQAYSGMRLTEPSDRISALQGITNRFGHFLNLDPARYCVAGLWLFDCSQLTWKRDHSRNWLTPEDDELARELTKHYPSWSWAISTEGASYFPIRYPMQLVEYGTSDINQRPRPAGPRFITIDHCISDVALLNPSSSTGMPTHKGLTLRGKFINWIDIPKLLELGQHEHLIKVVCSVPRPSHDAKGSGRRVKIWLDRPITDSHGRKGLKLLPIDGRRSRSIDGILVAFCGFDDGSGLAVYRRLGYFRFKLRVLDVDEDPFANYLHLPPEEAESEGVPPALRQDFDEFPPFKLI